LKTSFQGKIKCLVVWRPEHFGAKASDAGKIEAQLKAASRSKRADSIARDNHRGKPNYVAPTAMRSGGATSTQALAASCGEGPSLNPGQGRHWYYRFDRINNRRCWYVAETGPKTHENPPLEPTPSPTPPNSTLFSWFTSLGAGLPGSASAGMQPSATQGSRVPPAAPRESLKVVHAVAKERSRPGQRPEPKAAATEEGNQQSPSRSSAEHAEEVNSIRRRRTLCSSNFCDGRNCIRARSEHACLH
jgi:hypothetical protein